MAWDYLVFDGRSCWCENKQLLFQRWYQFSSVTQSCPTFCDPMDHSMPGLPVHHRLPESTQTYVHRISDAIQPSHPLLSTSPPAHNLSKHQGVFKWVSSSYQVAKYWSFNFSISPSNEYSGLISFRIDWFDLAVQGTLKSFLQLHSSKAPILRRSAFVTGLFIYLSIHLGHAVQLEACGILVPRSWFEPWPSAVKARRPNHWTTREVPPGRSKSRPDGTPLPIWNWGGGPGRL